MNKIELKIIEILTKLKDEHAAVAVKAEFEDEGTRIEELKRLKEICLAVDMPLTLKIGGCGAVRDMYDARDIGVTYLVAPMVETSFALEKYMNAISVAFTAEEQEEMEFFINVETIQAVQNFSDMLGLPEMERLNGIVVGRVDLVKSMGLGRAEVDSKQIFAITQDLLSKAKQKNLTCVVGGAVSADSMPFLRSLDETVLDKYETRKVCFASSGALKANPERGIQMAIDFELLWLKNKQNYDIAITPQELERINMLERRQKDSQSS